MFEGKSIFPLFAVDRPMPTGMQPPLFTVGRQKPEIVPADIAAAIDMLIDAENHQAGEEIRRDPKLWTAADEESRSRRATLDAVILKHLRGEV